MMHRKWRQGATESSGFGLAAACQKEKKNRRRGRTEQRKAGSNEQKNEMASAPKMKSSSGKMNPRENEDREMRTEDSTGNTQELGAASTK
jgi:hypothetical protein